MTPKLNFYSYIVNLFFRTPRIVRENRNRARGTPQSRRETTAEHRNIKKYRRTLPKEKPVHTINLI